MFLNAAACWRNIPSEVWNFAIGGCQVLKEYLSNRERKRLGRPLTPAEVRHVRDTARRLAAIPPDGARAGRELSRLSCRARDLVVGRLARIAAL